MITTVKTSVSKTGHEGRPDRTLGLPSDVFPNARNVLMNGFDQVFRRSLPKTPKIGLVQMPMLMTIAVPQIRARTLMVVPQLPRLNQAPLCGQPFWRAMKTPRLQRM